ncbi:MAG TPA: T9SS type A sorting domain-containing protein [Saprospiraceae bacterium]|nr:T9SS type A sorting domain-containing protein [Saprospiraceae bacterium]
MKHFKLLFLCFFSIGISSFSIAQEVKKATIVEHFTNTRCSICASRNPGFYNAKKSRPDVIHVAYHPSSPYSNCLFSTQNKAENDARTRYYEVFGGTPQFTINGEERGSSAMQNVTVYNSFDNKTTPLDVKVNLYPSGSDSIGVNVTIKAVADHNLTTLSLYVPLTEDTVFYNAPNGENQHYDVFRKSFTGVNARSFTAPNVGENDFVFSANVAKSQIWDLNRLRAIAIVNASDLTVVQAGQSALFDATVSSTDSEFDKNRVLLSLYPNPSSEVLNVEVDDDMIGSYYAIMDMKGALMYSNVITQTSFSINTSNLPFGQYIFKAGNRVTPVSKSFLKQK